MTNIDYYPQDFDPGKVKRRFIHQHGIIIWCVITFQILFKASNSTDILMIAGMAMTLFPLLGYIAAHLIWIINKRYYIEISIAKAQGITKRIPMHAAELRALIGLSAGGFLIISGNLLLTDASLSDYALPAIIIVPLAITQTLLLYKYAEEDYLERTTFPSPEFFRKQSFRRYWPVMTIFASIILLRTIQAVGILMLCIVFLYPHRRKLYFRSQKEFGNRSQENAVSHEV